ncbi:MAG: LPS assembly lipoprotein LptE [Proteobacteria bacterium]|nr:LPS assembly lipoprotein LptE [Pseudomonadota bacterium]
MRKKNGKLLILTLAVFFFGCGYSLRQTLPPTEVDLAQIKTVAVAPFTNLTSTKDAQKVIVELLVQSLFGGGKYAVVANDSVLKAVPKAAPNGVIDRAQAQKIGHSLKADAVIVGTVSEYWYQEEQKYYPDREPAVGITARLVDVRSGAVIGAVSISKTGGGAFQYLLSDNAGQLHQVAQKASEEVINALLP